MRRSTDTNPLPPGVEFYDYEAADRRIAAAKAAQPTAQIDQLAPAPSVDPAIAEQAALQAEFATVQAAQLAEQARAFADRQIAAGLATEAERGPICALFFSLAESDLMYPRSDGAPSSIALYHRVFTVRAQHQADEQAAASARAYAAQRNGRRGR